MFPVVSTGLSSPPLPTATAVCLDTYRLQLVRKNAFQITASVSSSGALLWLPSPNPRLTHSLAYPTLLQFNPVEVAVVLGERVLEWRLALPSVYPETSLLSGRD